MTDSFILWVASQYWYYASMWFETEPCNMDNPTWVGYGSQAFAYRNVLTEITTLNMLEIYCSWSFHYGHGKDSQGFCETMLACKR